MNCALQLEKEKDFKVKVDDQVARITQSCEKALRKVEQLQEVIACPAQEGAAEGHRARVTALEVRLSIAYMHKVCCSDGSDLSALGGVAVATHVRAGGGTKQRASFEGKWAAGRGEGGD